MPPAKQTPEQKLLAIFGSISSPEERAKLEAVVEEHKSTKQSPDEKTLEAEAVLLYFRTKGKDFVKQKCPKCDKTFAHKYYIPGVQLNCTNECRRASLADIGIEWNPNKSPEERWGMSGATKGTIPLIVPPAAFEIVESKLRESLAGNNSPVA